MQLFNKSIVLINRLYNYYIHINSIIIKLTLQPIGNAERGFKLEAWN